MFHAIKEGRNDLGKKQMNEQTKTEKKKKPQQKLEQAQFGGKDYKNDYSSRFEWQCPLLLLITRTITINVFNPEAGGIIDSVGMKVLE